MKIKNCFLHFKKICIHKYWVGYYCFAEAARENNCDSSGISKVCKGIRTNCGGYKWEQK